MGIGDWGLGIGDWAHGDWGLGPIPNPQSPIPIYFYFSIFFYQIKKINNFLLITKIKYKC